MKVNYIKDKHNFAFLMLVIGVGVVVIASYINSISGSLLSTPDYIVGRAGSKLNEDRSYMGGNKPI